MTTTVQATRCPSWCQHHLNDEYPADEFDGIIHQRFIEVGDATVVLQQTTGQTMSHTDPECPIVPELNFLWISEETIRNYADALAVAAGLLGLPRP